MTCPLCETIARARRSDHSLFIAELGESVVLLGENQGCPGWCVLVLKDHHEHLADLPLARQARLFEDVARAAAAIRRVLGPVRINYECLGNQVPHIHWHVIPRHADDPTPRLPVWGRTPDQLRGGMTQADREALLAKLRAAIAATAPAGPP
jgi:diadenosine tetraphosphate (Ap4A) HIT family hydrolase